MPAIRSTLAALAAVALAAAPLPAAAQATGDEAADADILVLAPFAVEDLPVQAGAPPHMRARSSQNIASEVDRFVRCTGLPEPRDLRAILDNAPRHFNAKHALHRFIAGNQGCYIGYPFPPPSAPAFGECNPEYLSDVMRVCRATYDRGALYERAIETYGEGIVLTRMQTFDPKVRQRFLVRAQRRDKLRVPMDLKYASTVGCMVQVAPEYARQLLAAEAGSEEETRARQIMIGLGQPCLGSAKRVKADAAQFRAYTAEAVYAWLVAAAERTTLVTG